jgi:hypothetical protein
MSDSQRFFAVSADRANQLIGTTDHTVFTRDDAGTDWAEASAERPVTGSFAVVRTTKISGGGDGTQWIGGPDDRWSKPPPLRDPGESLESYTSRHTPTTVAEPPAM